MKLILAAILLIPIQVMGQSKSRIDLDDQSIKGELLNDDRLQIIARQKNELKNYIKFRTNFREEILQELPSPRPRAKF